MITTFPRTAPVPPILVWFFPFPPSARVTRAGMACKLKSWKCFMKTLPEVATVAGIFRTNDCFKDLPDTKLDGFPCPAAVAFLPHPPCHQLHAAQRNIRPSVTHRSEETFEVETLHNNSSNRQALCKVENIFFLIFFSYFVFSVILGFVWWGRIAPTGRAPGEDTWNHQCSRKLKKVRR